MKICLTCRSVSRWKTNPFLSERPKIFSKYAFGANIYSIWGGARAKKNAIVLSTFSKKCPKTAFLTCFFFQKFACGAENMAKTGTIYCFRRARKINLVDLKKSRQNFWSFFKIPNPLQKILDQPLLCLLIFNAEQLCSS